MNVSSVGSDVAAPNAYTPSLVVDTTPSSSDTAVTIFPVSGVSVAARESMVSLT